MERAGRDWEEGAVRRSGRWGCCRLKGRKREENRCCSPTSNSSFLFLSLDTVAISHEKSVDNDSSSRCIHKTQICLAVDMLEKPVLLPRPIPSGRHLQRTQRCTPDLLEPLDACHPFRRRTSPLLANDAELFLERTQLRRKEIISPCCRGIKVGCNRDVLRS